MNEKDKFEDWWRREGRDSKALSSLNFKRVALMTWRAAYSAGYSEGHEDQMQIRILDAKERKEKTR